jgi:hypothetical protein
LNEDPTQGFSQNDEGWKSREMTNAGA